VNALGDTEDDTTCGDFWDTFRIREGADTIHEIHARSGTTAAFPGGHTDWAEPTNEFSDSLRGALHAQWMDAYGWQDHQGCAPL